VQLLEDPRVRVSVYSKCRERVNRLVSLLDLVSEINQESSVRAIQLFAAIAIGGAAVPRSRVRLEATRQAHAGPLSSAASRIVLARAGGALLSAENSIGK
jgi:hypothetical protein